MKQDVGFFDVKGPSPDLVIENGDLKADNGLETACLISMFSDARVTEEQLPSGETDPRGYWADEIAEVIGDVFGSNLWLFDRGKIVEGAVGQIQDAVKSSLGWMLDEGIAESIEVTASIVELTKVVTVVKIRKPQGDDIPFKFIWDGQALKLAG